MPMATMVYNLDLTLVVEKPFPCLFPLSLLKLYKADVLTLFILNVKIPRVREVQTVA